MNKKIFYELTTNEAEMLQYLKIEQFQELLILFKKYEQFELFKNYDELSIGGTQVHLITFSVDNVQKEIKFTDRDEFPSLPHFPQGDYCYLNDLASALHYLFIKI